MRRKTVYIILSIIIVISILITAATCNLCGIQPGTGSTETIASTDESIDKTTSEVTEGTKDTTEEESLTGDISEDSGQSDQEDSNNVSPTINLEISEGPIYSASDDVCYWRVIAIVTGNPTPKITWSQDYSNGSFGEKIAQINLTRDNPQYTLTATAVNSTGSATDNIELTWGCDDGDDEEETSSEETVAEVEEEPEVYGESLKSIGAKSSISGQIIESLTVFIAGDSSGTPAIYVGDTVSNLKIIGFLSFDVSELAGENVLAAWLNIKANRIGSPSGSTFSIGDINYGNTLDPSDYSLAPVHLFGRSLGYSDFSFSNDQLKNAVQSALNDGRQYYQVKLEILYQGNNDTADGFEILLSNVSLEVSYN